MAYALASVQQGRVADAEAALSNMAVRGGEGTELRPLTLCALALVAAADGSRRRRRLARPSGCPCTRRPPTSTRSIGELAAGLAHARDRRRAAGGRRGSARRAARVDATGDRLFQAVVRIADAVALRALGDPGAEAAERRCRRAPGAPRHRRQRLALRLRPRSRADADGLSRGALSATCWAAG